MRGYPIKEGKTGIIYLIAEGISVVPNEWGSWLVILRRGTERKKKAFGKGEENLHRAIKSAELLATKLGLALKREEASLTFGDLSEKWYRFNAPRWRASTKANYESIIRNFLRPLYMLPLEQVDRQRVKRLLVDLMQIRSANTVQVIHAVISGIFSEAIDLGYSNNNPAHGLLKRILPAKKKRRISMPEPFTQQDLERFLKAAWVNLPKPFPLILETMAMTGMRLGEALAMRVDNLDAQNCHYKITETTKLGRFGPPKSGERLVDLEETLVARLEAHIKQLRREGVPLGMPAQYLFPEITQRMVQRAVERACLSARLRRRHPHDLRHTYATILLMSHVSPAYIQKQLGHHSISMTVDIYGHWIPGEGKVDLTRTLRNSKPKPGRALALVTGAKSALVAPVDTKRENDISCNLTGAYTGAKMGRRLK